MKLVVTGAAGFIGSQLLGRLLADGHRVVGLDSFDPFYEPDLKRFYLRDALAHDGFRLVEADVRDEAAWDWAGEAGEGLGWVRVRRGRAGGRGQRRRRLFRRRCPPGRPGRRADLH